MSRCDEASIDDEVLGLPAQDSIKAHQEDAYFATLGRVQSYAFFLYSPNYQRQT
jgi:hypothetical protein